MKVEIGPVSASISALSDNSSFDNFRNGVGSSLLLILKSNLVFVLDLDISSSLEDNEELEPLLNVERKKRNC